MIFPRVWPGEKVSHVLCMRFNEFSNPGNGFVPGCLGPVRLERRCSFEFAQRISHAITESYRYLSSYLWHLRVRFTVEAVRLRVRNGVGLDPYKVLFNGSRSNDRAIAEPFQNRVSDGIEDEGRAQG